MALADGQADNTAPETLTDLADFLVDNPMTDPPTEKKPTKPATPGTDEPQGDDDTPSEEAPPAPDDEEDDDQEAPGDDDPEDAEEPTRERKLKVTVKGEDGADQTLELPEAEVVKGYMRQADYTRGKQELARQSNEAFQTATNYIEKRSAEYLETAQKQLQMIHALAGFRTDQEMAVLSQNDPAAWIQEQQRMSAVNRVTGLIEQNIAAKKQEIEAQQQQAFQQSLSQAWGTLGQAGIDKPKLKTIFDSIKKHYGIEQERFDRINDPKLVFIMRDAAAYRALQEKKPAVTQKVKEAPRLPPQRQATPPQAKLAKRINDRFKGGHAKLEDLAAYLQVNKI